MLLELGEGETTHRHRQQALLQSAVCQLVLAYKFYLCEIAANYQCPDPDAVADVYSLRDVCGALDKHPAEVEELRTLYETPGSWLQRLSSCHRAMYRAEVKSSALAEVNEHQIPVAATHGEDWSFVAVADVSQWIAAFNELIDRQREVMVEY